MSSVASITDDNSRLRAGEHTVPEPFVVASKQSGKQWSLDRDKAAKEARASNVQSQLPTLAVISGVKVGDYLVMFADEESRSNDAEQGYMMPFSIAEVVEVNVSNLSITATWMFATFVDGVWSEWEVDDENIRQSEEPLSMFQQADWGGQLMNVKFTKGMRLDKKSKDALERTCTRKDWSALLTPRKRGRERCESDED